MTEEDLNKVEHQIVELHKNVGLSRRTLNEVAEAIESERKKLKKCITCKKPLPLDTHEDTNCCDECWLKSN